MKRPGIVAPPQVREMDVTCVAAPVQIEGVLHDGRCFYFRSRHRHVTIGIGSTPDGAVWGTRVSRPFDRGEDQEHPASWLDDDEASELLADMLAEALAEDEQS